MDVVDEMMPPSPVFSRGGPHSPRNHGSKLLTLPVIVGVDSVLWDFEFTIFWNHLRIIVGSIASALDFTQLLGTTPSPSLSLCFYG